MAALVESLTKLPGVGYKTASRLAYHIVNMKEADVKHLADTIRNIKTNTKECSICFNTIDSDKEICDICASDSRDESMICVVKLISPFLLYINIYKIPISSQFSKGFNCVKFLYSYLR